MESNEGWGATESKPNVAFILLSMLIQLGFGVAELYYGYEYVHQCPAQNFLLVYLQGDGICNVVVAFIFAATLAWFVCRCCRRILIFQLILALISFFQLIWLITGSVFVYKIKNTFSSDDKSPSYCNPTLYWFAFWIITARWIVIALMAFCRVIQCCCGIICNWSEYSRL